MLERVAATQVGTLRALAAAFGEKRLPDLPDYDDVLARRRPDGERLPEWMHKFEDANKDRRAR